MTPDTPAQSSTQEPKQSLLLPALPDFFPVGIPIAIIFDVVLFGIPSYGLLYMFCRALYQSRAIYRGLKTKDRALVRQRHGLAWLCVAGISACLSLYSLNNTMAERNSTRIVDALHDYKDTHGEFPQDLDALVPEHIDSIPISGFKLMHAFHYIPSGNDFGPTLMWTHIAPFGRPFIRLEDGSRGYFD